jgi:ComF family protein
MLSKLAPYYEDFISLIFPHYCAGCNGPLLRDENLICSICRSQLPLYDNDQHGEAFLLNKFYGELHPEHAFCLLKFHKKGITQSLLHQLKYANKPEIGIVLGRILGHIMSLKAQFDVVIPVPLHPDKLKQRGYNQSEYLAMGVAESLQAEVNTQALCRASKSETQTKKSREQRWENVEGIFRLLNPEAVHNKRVLMVDDVLTTGATLGACLHELIKGEPSSFSVGFIAYAV